MVSATAQADQGTRTSRLRESGSQTHDLLNTAQIPYSEPSEQAKTKMATIRRRCWAK